jgi:short-subunit dehydrogenase
MSRRNILITGASSGLGQGMARIFAAQWRDLGLTAHRVDRLEALRTEGYALRHLPLQVVRRMVGGTRT